MKPQNPAEGISTKIDLDDCKSYLVTCNCGDNAHDHHIYVEANVHGIEITIYVDVSTDDWSEIVPNRHGSWKYKLIDFYNNLYRKLKNTVNLWIDGKIVMQTSLILSEQGALNYSAALSKAAEDVKKIKQQPR